MRLLTIIAIAVTSLAAVSPERPPERLRTPATPKRVAVGVGDHPDALSAAAAVNEVNAYLAARYEAELAAYVAEVERQAAADEAAARTAATRQAQGTYHPGSTVGDCTGFSIPDYIIARESGGNPSAYNPSGAYGCAQTLLSHYSSGSCRGLDPYTIEGQRACVDILSAGGSNLAPWAMTR